MKGFVTVRQKKVRRVLVLWLIAILFFVGVGAILYPMVSNLISEMTANTVIEGYQSDIAKMPPDSKKSVLEIANEFNQELFEGVVDKDKAKCLNRSDGIMCYLDIPKINVYLPVYYGTSDKVLEKGCGYLENTSLPIGGLNTHSVISGHTGLPSAEMLTNLDKVSKGDVFYIHILDDILAYRIDDIHSVLPHETDRLEITPKKDYLTLLTCTPYGVNDHRLLVRGERIEYNPDENSDESEQVIEKPTTKKQLDDNIFRQAVIIFVISFLALVVFAIAFVILYINRREYLEEVRSSKDG